MEKKYLLNEEEYSMIKGMSLHIEQLTKENEDLRSELNKQTSAAYDNHKLATSYRLQVKELEAEVSSLQKSLDNQMRIAQDLRKGSDFDLDKFRILGHVNEDGTITKY